MVTATLDVPEQNPDLVLDQSADDYWNHYQLTFALYSVSDRAIPSAFDGLKPGQRRLLYQMHDSRLLPGNKPQKSSKVCSAVTGNLHPHGGASMYGAAALMAAEFQRVKVIDGQGAFPRIQGDIPAADRYTEMRLSAPGAALTAELDDHAVPMVQTFDGEWTEPTVLPAQWPVLLCNGAVGIAEGWATKVPAHNPREVMAACRALLARPEHDRRHVDEAHSRPRLGLRGHRGRHGRTAGVHHHRPGRVHGARHGVRRREERHHHRTAARCRE